MSEMIVLHASFPIDPDRREEALDLIADQVEVANREEEGLLEYRATTDLADPNVVRFFERYEDEAALEAHTETDHFEAFQAGLDDVLAGPPEIRRFEVASMADLGA